MITFNHVSKAFGDQLVLKDFNLTIPRGEIFVLVGPSGSGKSTSLKMINGLIQQSEGDILFEGENIQSYDLQKLRWKIGYVLQQIALFPNMTVQRNIAVIPEMLGWPKQKIVKETKRLLKRVDLDPETYLSRYPSELSGGEQQRIGIIRAIIAQPEIILMDEPFSALDPIIRESLQDLVVSLHDEFKTTIVFVTHDMKEALRIGDRIGIINDGILEQVGTPQSLVNNPETAFVKQFFSNPEQNHQTVRRLIDNGYYNQDVAEDSHPSLQTDTLLSELYSVLASNEQVNVYHHDQYIGRINRQDILHFLAKE